jgi:hypothetical protein
METIKKYKVLLAILSIILGWFLNVFAWTTKIGHSLSSICLILGICLFFIGTIFLIIIIIREFKFF